MFGTYRTLLALMVVLLHYAYIPLIGEYAVFGFFALSGFLMTLIMQRRYGYSLRGFGAYAVNRALRIYPVYWAACLVAIAALLYLDSAQTTGFNRRFFLPVDAAGWFNNLAIILPFKASPALISPAWALTIELFFYLCIGLGLSRNRPLTAVWFTGSVGYTIYLLLDNAPWGFRYYTIGAASLPFSAGAMIWHWRETIDRHLGRVLQHAWAPATLFVLILVNWYAAGRLGTRTGISFYLNFLLCCLMIPALYTRRQLPLISRSVDNWIGNLSYPMYVVHLPLAYLLMHLFRQAGLPLAGPEPLFFVVSLPFIILASWIIAVTIESNTERLRAAVKTRLGNPA